MKKVVNYIILIIALSLISCGGGGGGGGGGGNSSGQSVTPPGENIVGSYSLRSFVVEYSNGVTLTERNFSSFSGTMTLGPTVYRQRTTIGNFPFSLVGTQSITYTKGTSEGIIHITTALESLNVSFAIFGNMITTYANGINVGNGVTAEEWDTWEKTSDIIESSSAWSEDVPEEPHFRFIGEIIIDKNMIYNEVTSQKQQEVSHNP